MPHTTRNRHKNADEHLLQRSLSAETLRWHAWTHPAHIPHLILLLWREDARGLTLASGLGRRDTCKIHGIMRVCSQRFEGAAEERAHRTSLCIVGARNLRGHNTTRAQRIPRAQVAREPVRSERVERAIYGGTELRFTRNLVRRIHTFVDVGVFQQWLPRCREVVNDLVRFLGA